MFRMRHTVFILFIIVIFNNIYCDEEIATTIRDLDLKIRDQTANATTNFVFEKKSITESWKSEKIKTPSGASVFISSPVKYWRAKCGAKSKLIYLHKNGTLGWKEYELVSSVIDNSKGSGCFQILKIRKVKNGCLWRRYKSRREDIMSESGVGDTNERLLFLEMKNNVWQSTKNGLDERMSPGGSLGAGIYFTDQFSVADAVNKCTSCIRKVLLCRVMLGNVYEADGSGFYAHAPIGHHSVSGRPPGTTHGVYVVYRGEQVYPEFVITYKTCDIVTTPAPKKWSFLGIFS